MTHLTRAYMVGGSSPRGEIRDALAARTNDPALIALIDLWWNIGLDTGCAVRAEDRMLEALGFSYAEIHAEGKRRIAEYARPRA